MDQYLFLNRDNLNYWRYIYKVTTLVLSLKTDRCANTFVIMINWFQLRYNSLIMKFRAPQIRVMSPRRNFRLMTSWTVSYMSYIASFRLWMFLVWITEKKVENIGPNCYAQNVTKFIDIRDGIIYSEFPILNVLVWNLESNIISFKFSWSDNW